MEKSTQIFTIIKHQKKILNTFFLNSVFRTCKNYYPQVFLEEDKYVAKEKKIPKYIIDDIEILQILVEKILMKKILIAKILMKKIKKY